VTDGNGAEQLQSLCLLIPERERLAKWMASDAPLSPTEMWQAVRDLHLWLVQDSTILHLPGRKPVQGACPVAVLTADAMHLRPSEVPSYLHDYMARFQDHLKTLNLPPVEEMWYSQILLGRVMSLTTLHAMCITHGDVPDTPSPVLLAAY
jgi:hypothetical protein